MTRCAKSPAGCSTSILRDFFISVDEWSVYVDELVLIVARLERFHRGELVKPVTAAAAGAVSLVKP
jgi:hypothetical protein